MRDTFRHNRALLIERARKLERMGLATEIEIGQWIVSSKAEPALRELGERGDIIKTMHRALEREGLVRDRHPASYVVHRENATERIVGRVLDKGLVRRPFLFKLQSFPADGRWPVGTPSLRRRTRLIRDAPAWRCKTRKAG
jgi:hypothetical protein